MKSINFLGLGFELGQSKKGLVQSPIKAREYFYILKNAGISIHDAGDVQENRVTRNVKFHSKECLRKFNWDKYKQASEKCFQLYNYERQLVNWGGDHSMAISSVSAFLEAYNNGHVLWIDAHADLNIPEASITGNLHGMPLSILLNLSKLAELHFPWIRTYLKPERLIYVGLRDLDPFEEECIQKLGIKAFSRKDVVKMGIENVVQEILDRVQTSPLHISFDIDSVDPGFALSTGVPVKDGLNPMELDYMAAKIHQNLNVKSLDIVEINPFLGQALDVDQTFITAIHFLKNILAYPGGNDESMGTGTQTEHFIEMEWAI